MNELIMQCLAMNDLSSIILEGNPTDVFLKEVISFCNSDLLDARDLSSRGWWNIPYAGFVQKLRDVDDKKIRRHIIKTKKILKPIVYRNCIYSHFIKCDIEDQNKLFEQGKKTLRKMIKTITYDIIVNQICTGIIHYEPKVISMCLCMYISCLGKNVDRQLELEYLFKKYNKRQYNDVKLFDFEEIIFVNECDVNLTSFTGNVVMNYNMNTYRYFSKHDVYIKKILALIENHLKTTNNICLYKYLSIINNKIFAYWMLKEIILLPKELVHIIILTIINIVNAIKIIY